MVGKNTISLWYDSTTLDTATFQARTFSGRRRGAVDLAPGDFSSGQQGEVLTVEFPVMGIPASSSGQVGPVVADHTAR
jgi:predicted 3-demethylubiquinone-9 3-methyltransferase (glyoxalase superfamily)